MSTPTLGRIAYLSAGDIDKRWIVPEEVTSTAVALVEHWQDAERMVACWNACMGISTENLENIDMVGDTLTSRIKLMKAEADGGYALLKEVLKSAELGELIPSPGNGTDLVDRIRAFVSGGA